MPRLKEDIKESYGGSTDAAGQLNEALVAINTFNKQADDYLQQAGGLQQQAVIGKVGIEVQGMVNVGRIAVARMGALAAIERAKNDALSQVICHGVIPLTTGILTVGCLFDRKITALSP